MKISDNMYIYFIYMIIIYVIMYNNIRNLARYDRIR